MDGWKDAPIPRKQNKPVEGNVRAASSSETRVIRDALVPSLHLATDTVQHGAVKKGSTECSCAVRALEEGVRHNSCGVGKLGEQRPTITV